MLKDAKCVVFKVGTSSITHENGKADIKRMEELVEVLADLMNSGLQVVLVTSGAIGIGTGKMGLREKPHDTAGKQAAATVGQCELMFLYDKMFSQYGYNVGQLLITREDVEHEERRKNLAAAFEKLFEFGAIPIINENDAVAVEEIVFGDNDNLSAVVASLIKADALVILTETNGLYDSNPKTNPNAKRISVVEEITDEIRSYADDGVSTLGTGGMITKIHAAQTATANGVDTYVIQGEEPKNIYHLIDGEDIGTHFVSKKEHKDAF